MVDRGVDQLQPELLELVDAPVLQQQEHVGDVDAHDRDGVEHAAGTKTFVLPTPNTLDLRLGTDTTSYYATLTG